MAWVIHVSTHMGAHASIRISIDIGVLMMAWRRDARADWAVPANSAHVWARILASIHTVMMGRWFQRMWSEVSIALRV
jgi:hypothetical protein